MLLWYVLATFFALRFNSLDVPLLSFMLSLFWALCCLYFTAVFLFLLCFFVVFCFLFFPPFFLFSCRLSFVLFSYIWGMLIFFVCSFVTPVCHGFFLSAGSVFSVI